MKNLFNPKSVSCIFFFSIISFELFSQSVPKIQEISLRAPANIKIDGKTSEWPDDKLQAYNYTDGIWYTISNDDNKLYLTIRAPYRDTPDKIMTGGLTFTVSPHLEKKDREKSLDNVSIKFPIIDSKVSQGIINSTHFFEDIKRDTIANRLKLDLLVRTVNKKAIDAFKEIQVTGIKDIKDSIISIYNSEGIAAMGLFNRRMALTYELAIPLKYLGISLDDPARISYNIKVNGRPETPIKPGMKKGINEDALNPTSDYFFRMTSTDFWGEYKLAKKRD